MLKNMFNKFKMSKTVRFELIPVGKTLDNIKRDEIIDEGIDKYNSYLRLKPVIDDYYKEYLDKALLSFAFSDASKEIIHKIFESKDADEKDLDKLKREITKHIMNFDKDIDAFKEKLIDNKANNSLMENFLTSKGLYDDYKEDLDSYKGFTTFLTSGFLLNRSFIFKDIKEGSIAYRIINDNLLIYFKNIYNYIKNKLIIDDIMKNNNLEDFRLFDVNNYEKYLIGRNIEAYNSFIGGLALENKKIKGINEYINEYNQKHDKNERIALFSKLKKQILAEKESLSFILDRFEQDEDLFNALIGYQTIFENNIKKLANLINQISEYDLEKIYIKFKSLSTIGNSVYDDYSYLYTLLRNNYDENYTGKTKAITKKYQDIKAKYFKDLEESSLYQLNSLVGDNKIIEYFKELVDDSKINTYILNYKNVINSINDSLREDKKVKTDLILIEKIKELLDNINDFKNSLNIFSNINDERDLVFYNKYEEIFNEIMLIEKLYNQTRNYLTEKPFSTDKIRLYFGKGTLLTGWSETNGRLQYCSAMLISEGNYYLAVLKRSNSLSKLEETKNGDIKILDYYQMPNPFMFLPRVFIKAKNARENYGLSDEILEIYNSESFKKENDNFDKDKLYKLIDYYKKCLSNHEKFKVMSFSDNYSYNGINDFFREIVRQAYILDFKYYNKRDIEQLINDGEIYLFQIYSKDFSSFSKGKKNLQTIYFEELFSEENIKNPVYKLLGGGQIFYRKASYDYMVTHPKNEKIKNKNPNNKKEYSVFDYDLIKNKRYTKDKFLFHFPIEMNTKEETFSKINEDVIKAIRDTDEVNIIGIDRGERNLIYLSVINSKGEIIEQESLNILNDYDYHRALMIREKELLDSRKSWKKIGSIKELKSGYLSQVVHKISRLIDKYQAIVVLENLNMGFKNSRKKIERSVYQKFEKALIYKLNYLIFKDRNEGIGSVNKAYQLTYKVVNFRDIPTQVGNIFYVDPYLTSNVDPSTGYAKLIFPNRNKTIKEMHNFIDLIDDIRFNEQENYFEFDIDYGKFPTKNDIGNKWTICTHTEKIVNKVLKDKKKKVWEAITINPTKELKRLFSEKKIDLSSIKDNLLSSNDKELLKEFLYLLDVSMQLRSSNKDSLDDEVIDKIISPVKNKFGEFYSTDNYKKYNLPESADANGAYNIALKGLMLVDRIKNSPIDKKCDLSVKRKDFLEYIIDRNK